jgi:hypothetical protein
MVSSPLTVERLRARRSDVLRVAAARAQASAPNGSQDAIDARTARAVMR